MQVKNYIERDDIDGLRGMIEREFILDEDDKEIVKELFKQQEEKDTVYVTLIADDGDVYSLKVDKNHEVLKYYCL